MLIKLPLTQDLTKSSVHPMGGQAYLSLENSEDPFLHGIKFTAMPPSKRFREMEQLSGGEKVGTNHHFHCLQLMQRRCLYDGLGSQLICNGHHTLLLQRKV